MHFPNLVQASSQAHNIELSIEPKLGETQEEKCKMCRLCQVPCQAALLYPELRPYNRPSVFVHVWPTFQRTHSHLRQQVLCIIPSKLKKALQFTLLLWL